jgi:2-polyprenyl-6-methoxyphenol hydroxylase-like FAD-dependent oxidoreductase
VVDSSAGPNDPNDPNDPNGPNGSDVPDSPVVIVGAGPTGLLLAAELGLAGVSAVVLDRLPAARPDSPGVAINAATVELLHRRGLMDRLAGRIQPLPMAHFSLLFLDLEAVSERYLDSVILAQVDLEAMLATRAVELGARIRRGCEVTGLVQDADGVRVELLQDGESATLRCCYLVGCDGEDSAVRRLVGIEYAGREVPFRGITGDLELELADLAPLQIGAHYYPAGGQWMCAPVEPGILRVTTAEFDPAEPVDPAAPVTSGELRAAIGRLTGVHFTEEQLGDKQVRWLNRTGCRIRNARTYRDGNVLLAGDAAHAIFPVNGQALHSCLRDAVNLGWKLAAVVRGHGDSVLLDTYQEERHEAARRMCANVDAQVNISRQADTSLALRDLIEDLIRLEPVNAYLAELVMGVDEHYPMAHPDCPPPRSRKRHPLLGRQLPDLPLDAAAGPTSTSRVLHPGRGVLLDLSGGALPADLVTDWADRVDVHHAVPHEQIAAAALLLRPDGHVAWAAVPGAADVEDLRRALTAWFGTPGAAA